jgi:Domain of unknown function (DUF4399)
MIGRFLSLVVLAFIGLINAASVQSQELTPSPPGAAVYFIGLKDGDTIPTKTTIHFGLRGMGGEHTLQLVFGDKNHVPHAPPVMSERIKVKVADQVAPAASEAAVGRHSSPKDAKVYFIYPKDGSYISPTPVIRFGLLNMGVAPAGLEKPNTGHHHLLIDTELPPLDQPIPSDFNHLHFGAGQTEAKITLPPGQHKLRLLFADANHIPHEPAVYSDEITVNVTADGRPPRREKRRRHRWRS